MREKKKQNTLKINYISKKKKNSYRNTWKAIWLSRLRLVESSKTILTGKKSTSKFAVLTGATGHARRVDSFFSNSTSLTESSTWLGKFSCRAVEAPTFREMGICNFSVIRNEFVDSTFLALHADNVRLILILTERANLTLYRVFKLVSLWACFAVINGIVIRIILTVFFNVTTSGTSMTSSRHIQVRTILILASRADAAVERCWSD